MMLFEKQFFTLLLSMGALLCSRTDNSHTVSVLMSDVAYYAAHGYTAVPNMISSSFPL